MDENLFQIQGEPHLQTISLDYSYLKKSSEHLLTQIHVKFFFPQKRHRNFVFQQIH